jgi:hypothetical protein
MPLAERRASGAPLGVLERFARELDPTSIAARARVYGCRPRLSTPAIAGDARGPGCHVERFILERVPPLMEVALAALINDHRRQS